MCPTSWKGLILGPVSAPSATPGVPSACGQQGQCVWRLLHAALTAPSHASLYVGALGWGVPCTLVAPWLCTAWVACTTAGQGLVDSCSAHVAQSSGLRLEGGGHGRGRTRGRDADMYSCGKGQEEAGLVESAQMYTCWVCWQRREQQLQPCMLLRQWIVGCTQTDMLHLPAYVSVVVCKGCCCQEVAQLP